MIPKEFTLGTSNYKVKLNEGDNPDNVFGTHFFVDKIIEINSVVSNYRVTQLTKEQAFFHELVHTILTIMGENELNNDARFVDLFSTFLHSYEIAKKF